jgi:tRNA pseudouridine55 synthase
MSFPGSKKSASRTTAVSDLPSGLLLLDKPSGVTSFDCVQVAKRQTGAARAGHCGTLDPGARGLLLILVGTATRQQESFLGLEKEYWFRSELGVKTATGDREGSVIEQRSWGHVTMESLEVVLQSFMGNILQTPPMYSALKYKGKPYYHYARKGLEVPRHPRGVSIVSLSLLSFRLPFWEARVVCSRGTYIRTLVEDVASCLGTCGTLLELIRERIGPYHRTQALTWNELRALNPEGLRNFLRPAALEPVTVHA